MMYFPELSIATSSLVATKDNATLLTGWASMRDFDYVMFVINTTDADADTTIDAKVQSADDSSGTNAADITGLAITQFTAAATAKQAILIVRQDQVNSKDTHVGCTVTAGNGTSGAEISIIAIGVPQEYSKASDFDAATVVQRKTI